MQKQSLPPKPKDASTRAFSSLVRWFVKHREAWSEEHPALAYARSLVEAFPSDVLRPVPYAWIFRLATEEGFAPASLCNALCLGDRWALAESVGFSDFVCLEQEQSEVIAASRFPHITTLDLSLQSFNNPLCPGTLFAFEASRPSELIASEAFPSLVALDISGLGIDVEALDVACARRPLRVLVARELELDPIDLSALAESRTIRHLECLDLSNNYFAGEEICAFLRSPHLGQLQVLRGLDLDDVMPAQRDELAATVRASSLRDEVKKALLEGKTQTPVWMPFEEKGFPGERGGKLPDEEDEDDDGDGGFP